MMWKGEGKCRLEANCSLPNLENLSFQELKRAMHQPPQVNCQASEL